MNDQEKKILGALRTAWADIDEAFTMNIEETIQRMTRDGFSDEDILDSTEYMHTEQAYTLAKLEERIREFKEAHK